MGLFGIDWVDWVDCLFWFVSFVLFCLMVFVWLCLCRLIVSLLCFIVVVVALECLKQESLNTQVGFWVAWLSIGFSSNHWPICWRTSPSWKQHLGWTTLSWHFFVLFGNFWLGAKWNYQDSSIVDFGYDIRNPSFTWKSWSQEKTSGSTWLKHLKEYWVLNMQQWMMPGFENNGRWWISLFKLILSWEFFYATTPRNRALLRVS